MKKFLLTLLLALCLTACGQSKSNQAETQVSDQKDSVEITDVRGRKVTVSRPIKNAYYPFFYQNLMEVGGENIFEQVGSTSVYDTKNYSETFWKILEDKAPGFKDIVDIGSTIQNDFNFEKLVDSKPDVVILANYQYDGVGETNLKHLEELGIPVVFIDFTDLSTEGHIKSCKILGQVFGQENRAQELIDQYQEKRDKIDEIVAQIPESERKTSYFELRSGSPSFKEYGKAYGKNGNMGQMASFAGILNIYAPVYTDVKVGDVDPEFLFQKDPNFIFLDGGSFGEENSVFVKSGVTITDDEAQETLSQVVNERPGWENLSAVKNKNVYTTDNDLMRSMRDYVLIEYLGQAAYPEYFKDFNPIKENKEFMEKYLPQLPADSCYFAQWQDKK